MKSGTVCEHIKTYYPATVRTPIFYWIINEDDLYSKVDGGEQINVIQERSSSGDDCHYDIKNLTDGKARKFCTTYLHTNLYICDEQCNSTLITSEEYPQLGEKHKEAIQS